MGFAAFYGSGIGPNPESCSAWRRDNSERPGRDAVPSVTGWTASSGNGESSMSARVAAEAGTSRVERHSRLGGGRNGRRESGSQDQITEWKPTRPGGRPPAILLRPAHTLSRTSFVQNPGNNRSNGPDKTAQLVQQALKGDQRSPAEASNHHLGFPVEPIVLQLTKGSRLSRRAICCPPDRDTAEAPETFAVPVLACTYVFKVKLLLMLSPAGNNCPVSEISTKLHTTRAGSAVN